LHARNTLLLSIGIAAAALIAVRAAMPHVMKSYINGHLAEIGEYRGRVEDVDVSLLRGAYVVEDLRIVKIDSEAEEPFLDVERMDVSLQWSALLHAELVGEMLMHRPVLNLIQGETDRDTQLGTGVNWPEQVREFFPFRFNVVEVQDGSATFRAPGIEADESLTVQELRVILRDLTNVRETQDPAFARLEAEGAVMGNAPIRVGGRFNPNESLPTFDLDLTIEGAELTEANPWLRQFIGVDAERGVFSMYAELATSQGRFEGYIKPILEDPQIFDLREEAEGPFQRAWEALVEIGMNVFKNREEDQVATEIPFSGEIEDPEADLLATAVNLLRNAFVSAFSHSLEGKIGLRDVQIGASAGAENSSEGPEEEP
jgi:hypothetical protein